MGIKFIRHVCSFVVQWNNDGKSVKSLFVAAVIKPDECSLLLKLTGTVNNEYFPGWCLSHIFFLFMFPRLNINVLVYITFHCSNASYCIHIYDSTIFYAQPTTSYPTKNYVIAANISQFYHILYTQYSDTVDSTF